MIHQSEGKIFLSNERGYTETDWFRSYNTFNFGQYKNVHKEPFSSLYVLNDDTLAGGKSLSLLVEEDSLIFLLPTVGPVRYKDSHKNECSIETGSTQMFKAPKNTLIEFSNPFENELINFLQFWFKQTNNSIPLPLVCSFDLEKKNKLLNLSLGNKRPSDAPNIYIGKFDGRHEVTYSVSASANGVFIFVLEGAFEVAYRLLETRDSLALWNLKEIEVEALSNDAIILLIELLNF